MVIAIIIPIKILGIAVLISLRVMASEPSPFPVLATINLSILKIINPQISPNNIENITAND